MKSREPAYVKHRREMLESPAWRCLTLSAHRVLERLEIEHMRHAGQDNGKLIVTYNDLVAFGLKRDSIAPAIRLLVEIGLIQITQRGWRLAVHGRPAKYRITYLEAFGKAPTDDWKTFVPAQKHRWTAGQNLKFRPEMGTTSCRPEKGTTSGPEKGTT
jgi:hypothetical protein